MSDKVGIPLQNLYYLLAYAWDHKLSASEEEDLSAVNCPDLNALFAKILHNGVERLLKRGLDRSYLEFEEQTARIRGSIDFPTSIKRQTLLKGQLHCRIDDLSADVRHNRIIKYTLGLLQADKAVDKNTRLALAKQQQQFAGVKAAKPHPSDFARIRLHRNNRNYRFLLHLCQLILQSLLPEQDKEGRRRFKDFSKNDRHMSWVFERYVLNFAKRHFSTANTRAMSLTWQADEFSEGCIDLLPKMFTDVTIEWPERKLILDCKFYREALSRSQHGSERFKTSNLYQIHAYLANKVQEPGWENCEGMLLYPTNGHVLRHSFRLHGRHRVQLCTLNLNQDWPAIHSDLFEILSNRKEHIHA